MLLKTWTSQTTKPLTFFGLFHIRLIIAIFCEKQKPFFLPLFWSISQRRLEHNRELNTIGFFFIWKTFIYFPTFISFGESISIFLLPSNLSMKGLQVVLFECGFKKVFIICGKETFTFKMLCEGDYYSTSMQYEEIKKLKCYAREIKEWKSRFLHLKDDEIRSRCGLVYF